MIAAIRPDDWDIPLLLHVAGAMLLVGTLVLAAGVLVLGRRTADGDGVAALTRLGFQVMLLGVVPSYILMRIGAQWIASKENLEDSQAAWIGIGYITADAGALLVIIGTVLAGLAARRARRGGGGGGGLATGATVISVVLIAAYVVAVWAMAAKPD